MQAATESIAGAAARLAAQAGRAAPSGEIELAGGKNNRVWRLDMPDGRPLVFKSYFSDPRDPRDRLAAEWAFVSYARSRNISNIPEPLARDVALHCGLYSFIDGRKLRADELQDRHIEAAIDFILALNAPPADRAAFSPGSEACFSLAQHVATVDRRVARLAQLDPEAPHRENAEQIVARELVPAWGAIKERIGVGARAAKISLESELPHDELIISPSDFGFHNALVDEAGRVFFLDFEYSGLDDPAKFACDFFCQPEVPVPFSHFEPFVDRVISGLKLPETARARCRLLINAYRIKWACIILNDFLPVGASRRAFAKADARERRCAEQIVKAQQKIAEVAL